MTVPSLSEVRAWTPEYLTDAAAFWERTACGWNEAFDDVKASRQQDWAGIGADALDRRVGSDRGRIGSAGDGLSASARGARAAADALASARRRLLSMVADAEGAGFMVGDDYTARCSARGLSPRLELIRQLEAKIRTNVMRGEAQGLAKLDADAAKAIEDAAAELAGLSFGPLDSPLPERPVLPPPVDGWSKDPITNAAQRIVAHSWGAHHQEWPVGTTREHIAAQVERMLRAASDPKSGLTVGLTKDRSPVIYDPATNILVFRDPNAVYGGTVLKPDIGADKLRTAMPTHLRYLSRQKLGFPPVEVDIPEPQPRHESPQPRTPRFGRPPVTIPPPHLVPPPNSGREQLPIVDGDGVPDLETPAPGDS